MEWRGREWSGGEGRGGQGRAGQSRAGQGRTGQGRAGQGRVPDCLGGLSRVGISSRSTRPWNGQPPSNKLSEKRQLNIGVPQGSVLGPILFLIYVNDINMHVDLGACNLYADDTLVYCSANNINELQECTQKCVTAIKEWYDNNHLVINASKCSIMVVTTKQREAFNNLLNIDVCLGDDSIDSNCQSNCIDYLGVKLDAHLTWHSQIDAVCKKLVFAIFRLGRLRNVIAPNMMLHIYQCIIQPRLDYAITLWGFTSQLNLSRVQRLQNRAARIITGNFDYINVRGIDIVKRLQWMNIIERRDYVVALTVFKCIRGMAPTYISDCIRGRSQLSTFMKAYREYAFYRPPPPYSKAYSKMLIFCQNHNYQQHALSTCTGGRPLLLKVVVA